jgi:hypothetical protein
MGGLGHAALHIKMKNRFGAAAILSKSAPAGISGSIAALAIKTIPDEIDIHVFPIRWPVIIKIIQKFVPVAWDVVAFKVIQGKGKGVVDSDERSGP